ncbi:MAG: hypothetical protein MRQ09_00375 [Candidatus Midichloria sp.]|nr:hypothetical protein [Candidatus Midichloria sp.]
MTHSLGFFIMHGEFMDLLHFGPLALIAVTLIAAQSYKTFTKKTVNTNLLSSVLLVLCSVGIVSGNHIHHGEMLSFLDPCFGYAATLIGVAINLVRSKVKVKA